MTSPRYLSSEDYRRYTEMLDVASGLEIRAKSHPWTLNEKVELLRTAKRIRAEAGQLVRNSKRPEERKHANRG